MLVPGGVAGTIGQHGNLRRRRAGNAAAGPATTRTAVPGPPIRASAGRAMDATSATPARPCADWRPRTRVRTAPEGCPPARPTDRTARADRSNPSTTARGRPPGAEITCRRQETRAVPDHRLRHDAVPDDAALSPYTSAQEGVQRPGALPQPAPIPAQSAADSKPGNGIERKWLLLQFPIDVGDEGDALGLADAVDPRVAAGRRRSRPYPARRRYPCSQVGRCRRDRPPRRAVRADSPTARWAAHPRVRS